MTVTDAYVPVVKPDTSAIDIALLLSIAKAPTVGTETAPNAVVVAPAPLRSDVTKSPTDVINPSVEYVIPFLVPAPPVTTFVIPSFELTTLKPLSNLEASNLSTVTVQSLNFVPPSIPVVAELDVSILSLVTAKFWMAIVGT